GVTWIPYILDRMDEEYEDRYYQLNLSMKPSELWRRQGVSTYQHEPSVAVMIPLIGEENVMWGSDYPHPDGIWPDSQKWISQDLGSVSPVVQRKILCENAGKLYGLLSGADATRKETIMARIKHIAIRTPDPEKTAAFY